MNTAFHNPDRYMNDLRQIISQGRKRLGFLIGAGAPFGIKVNSSNEIDSAGSCLIPNVEMLTRIVMREIEGDDEILTKIKEEIGVEGNIESLLSRVRLLSEVLNSHCVHGCDGARYAEIGSRICAIIGRVVSVNLPNGVSPYTQLVSWIGGVSRPHPVEIFTTNYDLLFEEAFERVCLAYFDGFVGSFQPFFDPSSVANDDLPARWARLWKIHGSLGWGVKDDAVVIRKGGREASELIYPEHMKYSKMQKFPYTSLFERLRNFLSSPDSILFTCGFSFNDIHIASVIEEALTANPGGSVLAFQFGKMDNEQAVKSIALRRANLSVYASDSAVISGITAPWMIGDNCPRGWERIRPTYWGERFGEEQFLLGDFNKFAGFFAGSQTEQSQSEIYLPGIGVVSYGAS